MTTIAWRQHYANYRNLMDARAIAWQDNYATPAQDIRDLRAQLRDGTVDFSAMEMSDR